MKKLLLLVFLLAGCTVKTNVHIDDKKVNTKNYQYDVNVYNSSAWGYYACNQILDIKGASDCVDKNSGEKYDMILFGGSAVEVHKR